MNLLPGHRRCCLVLCVSLAVLSLAGVARGAEPKKKPASATPGKSASVRLWKDAFASKRAVTVALRPLARKAAAADLGELADGVHFRDYIEVPAGSAMLEVAESANPKAKPETFPVQLAAGSFSTLLLRERDNEIVLECIDDTAPRDDDVAELTVRNFVPTLATLRLRLGDAVSATLASPQSFLHVRGLARRSIEVETAGTDTAGKQLNWTNDIDFKKCRRATLLIAADPYGRIRPRVVIDGQTAGGFPEARKD